MSSEGRWCPLQLQRSLSKIYNAFVLQQAAVDYHVLYFISPMRISITRCTGAGASSLDGIYVTGCTGSCQWQLPVQPVVGVHRADAISIWVCQTCVDIIKRCWQTTLQIAYISWCDECIFPKSACQVYRYNVFPSQSNSDIQFKPSGTANS